MVLHNVVYSLYLYVMAFEIVEINTQNNIQDIRIPEKFRIDDDRVYIKKVGNELHLIPYHSAWDSFFNSDIKVTDDFMETRDQGEDQERESFD